MVSLFFYCKVLRVMYLVEDAGEGGPMRVSLPMRAAVVTSAAFTVLICLYPAPFLHLAAASTAMWPI